MTFRMIVQLWNTNTSAFVSCDADLTENYMFISMKFRTGVHVFCWEVGVFNRSSFQSVSYKWERWWKFTLQSQNVLLTYAVEFHSLDLTTKESEELFLHSKVMLWSLKPLHGWSGVTCCGKNCQLVLDIYQLISMVFNIIQLLTGDEGNIWYVGPAGRRPRATFCLKVQHIICCPHHQSIIVLLYLHWFRIRYSIQTIHKQTYHDQTGLNLDELIWDQLALVWINSYTIIPVHVIQVANNKLTQFAGFLLYLDEKVGKK